MRLKLLLLIPLFTAVLSSCAQWEPSDERSLAKLEKWQHVRYPSVGIELDAPMDRYQESIDDSKEEIANSGNINIRFALDQEFPGIFAEAIVGVWIHLEVFSKEQWRQFLKGEGLSHTDRGYRPKRYFCPNLIYDRIFWNDGGYRDSYFRKDTASRDGRVVIASAVSPLVNENMTNHPVKRAHLTAIRRILESVHFIGE